MNKLMKFINNSKIFFPLIILILFILIKLPMFFEPQGYPDEGIYAAVAHFINSGSVMYKDVWDNKTPSIYFLFYISRLLFSYYILPLKIIAFGVSLLTFICVFCYSKLNFKNYSKTFIPVALFTFTLFNLSEGNTVNAEIFFIFFSIISFLILRKFDLEEKRWKFALAGFLIGVGVTFKFPALFDEMAFIFYYLSLVFFEYKKNSDLNSILHKILNISIFVIMSLVPHLLYACYFYNKGAFSDYLNGTLFSNQGYVTYFNSFNAIYINTLILLLSSLILLYYRKRFDKNLLFILIWLVFAIYATLLSGRSYVHYILQLSIPASFFIAYIITSKSFKKVALLLLITFLFVSYFTKTIGGTFGGNIKQGYNYYRDSYGYILGFEKKEKFYDNFGVDGVSSNYNYKVIADLNNVDSKNEKIYVWANLPWITAGVQMNPICKYINNYDLNTDERKNYVIDCYTREKPKYIIYEKYANFNFPELKQFIDTNYTLLKSYDDGIIKIYKMN